MRYGCPTRAGSLPLKRSLQSLLFSGRLGLRIPFPGRDEILHLPMLLLTHTEKDRRAGHQSLRRGRASCVCEGGRCRRAWAVGGFKAGVLFGGSPEGRVTIPGPGGGQGRGDQRTPPCPTPLADWDWDKGGYYRGNRLSQPILGQALSHFGTAVPLMGYRTCLRVVGGGTY